MECAHTMHVDAVLVVRQYVHHIYSDKHTSACEAKFFSPLNLSEGGSLHSPINQTTLSFKCEMWLLFKVKGHKTV